MEKPRLSPGKLAIDTGHCKPLEGLTILGNQPTADVRKGHPDLGAIKLGGLNPRTGPDQAPFAINGGPGGQRQSMPDDLLVQRMDIEGGFIRPQEVDGRDFLDMIQLQRKSLGVPERRPGIIFHWLALRF